MLEERKFSNKNRVAQNAMWIIGVKIVQSLLALVINMLTARYLGPTSYGLITYASSLVAFVAPIMKLGFDSVLVQELVNEPEAEGKILGTTMLTSFVSAVFCIIGLTSFVYGISPNEKETILVCLLYNISLLFQALEHITYWYQARLISKYTSVIALVAYVVLSGYKIFLLATSKSIYWFAISNSLDFAIIAIVSIVVYKKLGGRKLEFSWTLGKQVFSRSHHYILSSMMAAIFGQTDKIMIKMMIGETATGYYGAAVTCVWLTGFVFDAITDSFRPSILEGQNESEDIFKSRLTMLYSIVIYLSLAQSVVMTVFAKLIIYIFYGEAYSPAISALQIIVWYTAFSYIGTVRNIWILAKGKQRYLWIINMCGAVANVMLNFLLIPTWGINGAAIASLITQIFTNVIVGYIVKPIRPNNKIMLSALNPKYLMLALKKLVR